MGKRQQLLKWRCYQCGLVSEYWARAQRHADEQKHYRIEVIL